jgi:serine protease AprX
MEMEGTDVRTMSLERHLSLERFRHAWRALLVMGLAVALSFPASLPGFVGRGSSPASLVSPSSKVDASLLKVARHTPGQQVGVIVREATAASPEAEAVVTKLGGRVTRELPIISSFSARILAGRVMDLARSDAISTVWPDGKVRMATDTSQINASSGNNTVWKQTIRLLQAQSVATGAGVTVAVLDTGVAQSPDLDYRVRARIDLTSEQDGWDHFGHGTHMSGIVAGNGSLSYSDKWSGVAPDARLVSVKVAGADGSTDVSVVIAGLQWVVSHRGQYNIRVLNLSFGTDSTQSYLVDPLDYAVEQAWFAGITVVVAAGNRGSSGQYPTNKPADDPFVITVGAADLNDTQGSSDDTVASFSSRGPTQDGQPKPTLVAPGITIVSIRDPGSTIDQAYSSARVGTNYFKGTGTSQAAAVVSGVVALMYQASPSLTPNVVKRVLKATANKLDTGNTGAGAGLIDAYAAVQNADNGYYAATPANAGLVPSTGAGSIEASRGSLHVYADLPQDGLGAADVDGQLELVQGEIDALGTTWNATGWLSTGWAATGWNATAWASLAWTATGWSSTGWAATGWSGTAWSATGWDSTGWSSTAWNGIGWSSTGWSTPVPNSTGWSDPLQDGNCNGECKGNGNGNGNGPSKDSSPRATGWS